jgi:phosphate transport system permease protein
MIPVITRTTEEVLRLVPTELREAALALGVPEWRTLLQVILPSVSRGLITGLLLALTRIAGETAPLLLTAFGNLFWNRGLQYAIDALPLRIFNFAQSPYPVQVHQAYAGAFVLISILVLTSFGVRLATGGFRQGGR